MSVPRGPAGNCGPCLNLRRSISKMLRNFRFEAAQIAAGAFDEE